jgi:hypothetical protein
MERDPSPPQTARTKHAIRRGQLSRIPARRAISASPYHPAARAAQALGGRKRRRGGIVSPARQQNKADRDFFGSCPDSSISRPAAPRQPGSFRCSKPHSGNSTFFGVCPISITLLYDVPISTSSRASWSVASDPGIPSNPFHSGAGFGNWGTTGPSSIGDSRAQRRDA